MSFFFAMKKGDDDENKFSPPTPKIIEPTFFIRYHYIHCNANIKKEIQDSLNAATDLSLNLSFYY